MTKGFSHGTAHLYIMDSTVQGLVKCSLSLPFESSLSQLYLITLWRSACHGMEDALGCIPGQGMHTLGHIYHIYYVLMEFIGCTYQQNTSF